MGEVDGGAVVTRTAEQPGMARGFSGAELEKATTGGCAAYGGAAALEKTSDTIFFYYFVEIWKQSADAL
jgi:hypothetical protein